MSAPTEPWTPVETITVEFTREALYRFIRVLNLAAGYQVKWKVVEYEPGKATITAESPYKDFEG